MNILNELKKAAAKEVVGSVLKTSAPVEAPKGKKAKIAALLATIAAVATAGANYLS